jgi:hypothetical protein
MDRQDRPVVSRALAEALASQPWSDISAQLAPHGLELPEDKRGRYPGISGALERAEDAQLEALAHTVLPPDFDVTREALNPWAPQAFRLFLSHASQVHGYVGGAVESLGPFAIHGFVAHRDIEVQTEWARVIEYALDTCDSLIAFSSEDSVRSFWCNQEIGWALGRRLLIVSVTLGAAPSGFTSRFQGMRQRESAPLATAIFELLARDRRTAEALTAAVLWSVESSDSWETVRAQLPLVGSDLEWTPSTLAQLSECVRSNEKVCEAWGASALISSIFKRHGLEPDEEVQGLLRGGR